MGLQEALQNRNKSIIERRYIDDVSQENHTNEDSLRDPLKDRFESTKGKKIS